MFDLVIQNAQIVDGTGAKPYEGNVYLSGGRIAEISADSGLPAAETMDAKGLTLAPGFIDLHTHSDSSPYCAPEFESALTQGVTFHLAGNCGGSLVPNTEANHISHGNGMSVNKFARRIGDEGYQARDVAGYAREVTGLKPAIHLATLVGHGALRNCVMKDPTLPIPTPKELDDMAALLSSQLEQGAFGLSLGLTYKPGLYSQTEELIRLAKVVAEHKGVVAAHMRNEGDKIFEALDEMGKVARESGAHIHISHFKLMFAPQWGQADRLLAALDGMRAEGLHITCDQYPYCASSTGFLALLPGWAKAGSKEDILLRLKDDRQFLKMRPDITESLARRGGPTRNAVSYTCGGLPQCDGKTLAEAAEILKLEPEDAYREILIASRCGATAIYYAMDEQDVLKIAARTDIAVGSDGYGYNILSREPVGKPHPRSAGTFVRFLRLAREHRLMPLESAIHKMTGLPAEILGLTGRGTIQKGNYADLVLFDARTIGDRATFEQPALAAGGVDCVFVNGGKAYSGGVCLGTRRGEFILSSSK